MSVKCTHFKKRVQMDTMHLVWMPHIWGHLWLLWCFSICIWNTRMWFLR